MSVGGEGVGTIDRCGDRVANVGVPGEIGGGVEFGDRVAPFKLAVTKEMLDRGGLPCGNLSGYVIVGGEIEVRIEERARIVSLLTTNILEVSEPATCDFFCVWIDLEVVRCVEQ